MIFFSLLIGLPFLNAASLFRNTLKRTAPIAKKVAIGSALTATVAGTAAAVKYKDVDTVALRRDFSLTLEAARELSNIPLKHQIGMIKSFLVMDLLYKDNVENFRVLKAFGLIDFDYVSPVFGATVIYMAVNIGAEKIVQYFVKSSENVRVLSADGRSLLDSGALTLSPANFEGLLERGCRFESADRSAEAILDLIYNNFYGSNKQMTEQKERVIRRVCAMIVKEAEDLEFVKKEALKHKRRDVYDLLCAIQAEMFP